VGGNRPLTKVAKTPNGEELRDVPDSERIRELLPSTLGQLGVREEKGNLEPGTLKDTIDRHSYQVCNISLRLGGRQGHNFSKVLGEVLWVRCLFYMGGLTPQKRIHRRLDQGSDVRGEIPLRQQAKKRSANPPAANAMTDRGLEPSDEKTVVTA